MNAGGHKDTTASVIRNISIINSIEIPGDPKLDIPTFPTFLFIFNKVPLIHSFKTLIFFPLLSKTTGFSQLIQIYPSAGKRLFLLC